MKIKQSDDGKVEYVQMKECEDCGDIILMIDGEHFTSAEFLASDYKFVEIEREEIGLLNKFMEEAAHRLRVGWDYIEFTIDKEMNEMMEADEEGNEDA